MRFASTLLMIGVAAASIIPYTGQVVFRDSTNANHLLSDTSSIKCAGTSSVQSDLISISKLDLQPEFDGDDYLHFTPISPNYSHNQVAQDFRLESSTVLVEHKINGREGGVFFEFCKVQGPIQQQPKSNKKCPPEKGEAIFEVLDWLFFDMPAANYPFCYISSTPEGTGLFCVNGTTWDNRYNVQPGLDEQMEL